MSDTAPGALEQLAADEAGVAPDAGQESQAHEDTGNGFVPQQEQTENPWDGMNPADLYEQAQKAQRLQEIVGRQGNELGELRRQVQGVAQAFQPEQQQQQR